MSNAEVWKYLHDGSIVQIDGSVPGDVTVYVSINYLAKLFPGDGNGFRISLIGCTRFQLLGDDDSLCEDLAEIARRSPTILSVVSDSPLSIYTTLGTLNLAYEGVTLTLDSGEPVSVQSIDQASDQYWDAWSKRHKGSA